MVVVGADNDIVDALGADTVAIAAGGNAVGRLGRCQTHFWAALRGHLLHANYPRNTTGK